VFVKGAPGHTMSHLAFTCFRVAGKQLNCKMDEHVSCVLLPSSISAWGCVWTAPGGEHSHVDHGRVVQLLCLLE
jgi:hypothetical protein